MEVLRSSKTEEEAEKELEKLAEMYGMKLDDVKPQLYYRAGEEVEAAVKSAKLVWAKSSDDDEDEAPEGFTKSKLSYALTHQWKDEVTKVDGKVNAYTKA
jgi:hypothetical protein